MRFVVRTCALALCVGATGCQRIPDVAGQLPLTNAPFVDAIPAEYGDLMGVTSSERRPNVAQLWFQAPDRSVTVVYVDFIEGRIQDRVLSIPRR